MKRIACTLAVAVIWAIAGHPLAAAEVKPSLDQAQAAYDEGQLAAAADQAQAALEAIQTEMTRNLTAVLPGPPAGWQELETAAVGAEAIGTGLAVGRGFSRGEGEAAAFMQVAVVVNNPAVEGVSAVIEDPEALAVQPGVETVTVNGRRAIFRWEDGFGDLMLPLGAEVMVQVSGEGLDSREPLLALLQEVDIDAVQRAVGVE